MSHTTDIENYAHKLYLIASCSSDEDSPTDIAAKMVKGYTIEEVACLAKHINSLNEGVQWEFRKMLINSGHDIGYIRGKKIISHIGLRWHISPGESKFTLNIFPKEKERPRIVFLCHNQFAPSSPRGGIWLFTSDNGYIIAVTEGMDDVKNG